MRYGDCCISASSRLIDMQSLRQRHSENPSGSARQASLLRQGGSVPAARRREGLDKESSFVDDTNRGYNTTLHSMRFQGRFTSPLRGLRAEQRIDVREDSRGCQVESYQNRIPTRLYPVGTWPQLQPWLIALGHHNGMEFGKGQSATHLLCFLSSRARLSAGATCRRMRV
jgi:hypothetical protein